MASNQYSEQSAVNGLPPIIIPGSSPDIWGIKPETRLRKQLGKHNLSNGVLVLRGDAVYEDAVLSELALKSDTALISSSGERLAAHVSSDLVEDAQQWLSQATDLPASLKTVTPEEFGLVYNRALRKRAVPKCYIVKVENVREIEWDLYKTSYKGVTDLVTKFVWPVPAFHATRICAKFGWSPNMVTSVGAILMFAALWFFYEGYFGWGLLAGWIMTFLDTVDGKLARVTLTSSKWGNIFDHGIDLIHPPFWYIAWGLGLASAGFSDIPWLTAGLIVMFASYVGGRLCEGYFIRRFGFHIHVWRRYDSWFRLIVARRNPNMLMLTVSWLAGRPDIGLLLVVLWTAASVPIHLMQIAQAESARARGKPMFSWLSN